MRNLFFPGRSTVHSLNGMAATSQPMSSMTAISILQAGGNAMDAAVAAVAVQCVVEPQSTGIGGDCFCMYSPKGEGVVALNGSGRAPAAATAEWFLENGIEKIENQTPHSVTIPGAVDAWARLIKDHGAMSLGDVLQPAIGFARDGFAVNQRSALDFSLNEVKLAADPTAAEYYLRDGKGPKMGSVMKLPLLAKTLETIAEKGRDGFYTGAVAEDIVGFLRDKGGFHTMEDFDSNHPDYVTPISTNYRGYDVFECPPNGQGVVALAMLNILSGFDVGAMDPLSVDRLHLEIEAARLAYRDRSAVLADPSFVDVPVEKWLSEDYAAQNRTTISMDKRQDPLPPSSLPRHNDTVYVTVVDKDRNAVSIINTLYDNFGSGQVAPKSGVVLQNRGQGFVVDPGHAAKQSVFVGQVDSRLLYPGLRRQSGVPGQLLKAHEGVSLLQFHPIQKQHPNITADNQNGQNPLPGPSSSIIPMFSNRTASGFHDGGSPLFHIRYIERRPRNTAPTISALRIVSGLLSIPFQKLAPPYLMAPDALSIASWRSRCVFQ